MVIAMLVSLKISWAVCVFFFRSQFGVLQIFFSFGFIEGVAAFLLPKPEKNPAVLVTNLLYLVLKKVSHLTMFCNQNLHYKGET